MRVSGNPGSVGATGHSVQPLTRPAEAEWSFPDTLTLITTYQCNAACADCCFECHPQARGRLTLAQMTSLISRANREFPGLRLVAFSGGECFLLKDDLYQAIAHAHALGLRTRCVTNGFWGKAEDTCLQTVQRLMAAGIDEINISTGLDHQQWVPVASVIRAARLLVRSKILTVVTVEMDAPDSHCLRDLAADPDIQRLTSQPALFRLQCNSWMPFHRVSRPRGELTDRSELQSGCRQIFHNVTLTPSAELSACCGLTMEHIPEMKLGDALQATSLAGLYYGQLDDFLKIWIHVDGPYTMIRRLLGEDAADLLHDVVHICQACAILHQDPVIRAAIRQRYTEFVPEIMSRFYMQQSINAVSGDHYPSEEHAT